MGASDDPLISELYLILLLAANMPFLERKDIESVAVVSNGMVKLAVKPRTSDEVITFDTPREDFPSDQLCTQLALLFG